MPIFKTLRTLSVCAAAVLVPQVASAETIKDALRSAYKHSGLLTQNRALLRAADEDVVQGIAALRPIVEWSASYSYSNSASRRQSTTVSLGIDASWLLYDFGRSQLGIEALKETVLSQREALLGIEQDVLFRAANAYLNYRLALQFVELRQSNVRVIQKELSAANDRFDVGEVTRTDVALAQSSLANARSLLAQAQGQVRAAEAEFISAVGRRPQNPRAIKGLPRIPKTVNSGIGVARKLHPQFRQLQHTINAAELRVQQAKLAARPSVRASAGLSTENVDGTGVSKSAGISIGGPIYQGGALPSQVRKLTANRDAARAQLHVARHNIDQGVRNAYVDLEVARAQAAASSRQIKAASTAFNGIREEALLGQRTTLDVLNAEQDLLDARNALLQANIAEQVAAYNILAATGQMTAKALNLGVKTYDPAEYYNLVKSAPAAQSRQGQALDRVLKSIGAN